MMMTWRKAIFFGTLMWCLIVPLSAMGGRVYLDASQFFCSTEVEDPTLNAPCCRIELLDGTAGYCATGVNYGKYCKTVSSALDCLGAVCNTEAAVSLIRAPKYAAICEEGEVFYTTIHFPVDAGASMTVTIEAGKTIPISFENPATARGACYDFQDASTLYSTPMQSIFRTTPVNVDGLLSSTPEYRSLPLTSAMFIPFQAGVGDCSSTSCDDSSYNLRVELNNDTGCAQTGTDGSNLVWGMYLSY